MRRVTALAFWLAIWAFMSLVFDLEKMLLPDMLGTLSALAKLLVDPDFLSNLGITFMRVVPGIIGSTLVGIPLGIGLAASPRSRSLIEPLFSFFRGIPAAALFPVVIILFGIGEGARIALTLYLALPIVLVATVSGAMERPENRTRRDYLRLHRAELHWHHAATCLLWDALPSVIGGLKIALSLSLVIIITSEMFFVGGSGVGWYAWDQYQAFNIQNMYAAILSVGLISVALNILLDIWNDRISGN
jgi:ABC-type nitrate/sulfonate/bicarbonate transport system permease component